jgi:hypothetical protein
MFEGFEGEGIKVKMCELGKKKNLVGSWEWPYVFVAYKDGKGFQGQNERGMTCMIKGMDKKHWDRARKDL